MMDRINFNAGGDTLVLNSDGLPLSVVPMSTLSWRDSIKAMYLDHVDVLHTYEDWVVRSPSTEVAVPAVVMMRNWVRMGRTVKFSRQNVYTRDRYTCQYCNKHFHADDLSMDHVVPRLHGGKTVWDNIVTACKPCNHAKSHFTKMKPLNAPRKPGYHEFVEILKEKSITIRHPSWNFYLMWPDDKVKVTNK